MKRWYACRVTYDLDIDDGVCNWTREVVRCGVFKAPDADEASKIAVERLQPKVGGGWYVWSDYAEECESEEAALEKVRTWERHY